MSSTQRLEGPDLESLLAKVRADFGERAKIVEANRVRRGGVAGFFAKESFEVVVDVDENGDPIDAQAGEDGEDEDDEFVPFTLDELATRVDDPEPSFTSALRDAVEEITPAPAPEPEPEPDWPAQSAIEEVTPVVAATPKVARLVAGGLDGVEQPNGVPGRARTRPIRHTMPAASTPALPDRDLDALARLGVPVDRLALPERTDEPAAVALVRLLERLPAPPPLPRSEGAIVAVVGSKDDALAVVGHLGIDGDVVVASRKRGADVRTVADADERRRAWRRRKRPTVVVVDAPFGVQGNDWASSMLAALEPVVAMGHVDAGRKPEDIRAWADDLGGLDALAVDGIDLTTTPAAVLGAGVPVALVDGAPATPARWAALLTDRLAAVAA